MNRSIIKIKILLILICISNLLFAQKTISEYVSKTGVEGIMKSIVMGPGFEPVTAGGFGDGHGKNPLLTSTNQIPDTVALVSLYIYDIGTTTSGSGYITYRFVSENGGNQLSNEIYNQSIKTLKETFKKNGVVLLTPEEYLNTPEKLKFYNNEFVPAISKLGNFISNIENKKTDIAVGADYFRCFDISAAPDYLRSESLGSELTKKLNVKGALSIAVEIQSNGKNVNINGIKMSLHGPNPIPREDKKYVAQNMGNGYYDGQLYAYGYFFLKKPILVASFEKNKLVNQNFNGIDVIFGCFVDKFHIAMNNSIEKAAKKYNK
jgi:hypothetical protein